MRSKDNSWELGLRDQTQLLRLSDKSRSLPHLDGPPLSFPECFYPSWTPGQYFFFFTDTVGASLQVEKYIDQSHFLANLQTLKLSKCPCLSAAKPSLTYRERTWKSLSTRPPIQFCPEACNLLLISEALLSVHTQNATPCLLLKRILNSPLQL